jgi:hypothetical protein
MPTSEPVAVPTNGASIPAQTPSPVATAEPASGACANDHQPVADGDTWTYVVGGSGGGTGYTDTITTVGASGFAISSDFGRVRKETRWSCTRSGLVALQYGGGAAGALTSQGLWASLRTTSVTGVTIPRSIDLGDTWSQSFDVRGAIDVGGARTTASGSVDERFEAGGVVSVTVPAGTFDAVAIDTTIGIDIRTSVAGVRTPVKVISRGTTYLAEGVGMVKATSDTSLFDQPLSSTIELRTYAIS